MHLTTTILLLWSNYDTQHTYNKYRTTQTSAGRRSSNCYVTPAREEIIERKYKLYIYIYSFKSSNNFSEKKKGKAQ